MVGVVPVGSGDDGEMNSPTSKCFLLLLVLWTEISESAADSRSKVSSS